MNKKLIASLFIISALIPAHVLLAFDVGSIGEPGQVNGTLTEALVTVLNAVLNAIWIIAVAFVIIMFVVAGFKFLTAQGNASEIAEARRAVLWGLVGVAVIVLAWSVLFVVRNQLKV